MKLAVSLGHGLSPSESVAAALKMEKFGFDFVWFSESVGFDALPILGAVATRTEKVGLGSGIANVYSRSATQLAMAAATLQGLSKGRFTLGVGTSSEDVVGRWHGMKFARQLERMEEYVDSLRPRLRSSGGALPVPFSSVKESIPLFLAAVGTRMLDLARRKADGVIFFLRPLSDVRAKCSEVSSSTFSVCANVVTCVSEERATAEARARKTVAHYLTYGDSYRRLVEGLAPSPRAREAIPGVRHLWLKGLREEAARKVPAEVLGELAIFGTPSDCRRGIEEYAQVRGLSMLGLQFNRGSDEFSSSIDLYQSLPGALRGDEPSNI